MLPIVRTASAAALTFALAFPALAQTPPTAPSAQHTDSVKRIMESAAFKTAVQTLDKDHDRIVEDIIKLTEIPAPPFKEDERGKAYLDMLKAHGLTEVERDEEGNVMGIRKGTGGDGRFIVMSAHLDTVFPEETDVKVKRQGTRLYAPGVGDDTRSLSVLLGYLRAMDAAGIKTKQDILFVGTVGEEGQGDLRGVRHFFTKGKYKDKVAAFFSMDGTTPNRITNGGVGSKRYRVTFKGPGGHSYGAFGIVNPMVAMSTAVVEFNKLLVPAKPKTTYAASVTGGGTSVNSIPNTVFMEFDMRSEDPNELAKVEQRFLRILEQAAETENNSRSTKEGPITVEPKLIGDRPAGQTAESTDLVQYAAASIVAHGMQPTYTYSSTDSNTPMSLGIPAITIGSGGKGDRSHSLDEWIDVEKGESLKGMQVGLTMLLAIAEMQH